MTNKEIKEKIIKILVDFSVRTSAISYGDTKKAEHIREDTANQLLELLAQQKQKDREELALKIYGNALKNLTK